MKELTLRVEPEVIEEARELAEQAGTSVSSMFERYVRLLASRRRDVTRLGPLARKATGLIALPKDRSDCETLEDALLEKHGLKR